MSWVALVTLLLEVLKVLEPWLRDRLLARATELGAVPDDDGLLRDGIDHLFDGTGLRPGQRLALKLAKRLALRRLDMED